VVAFVNSAPARSQDFARVSEGVFRSIVQTQVLPEYPLGAIRARQTGVVVADVTLDRDHNVANVEILQSPSSEISRSVVTSVRKWTFLPPAQGYAGKTLSGKLTFYFARSGSRFRVFDSTNAPKASVHTLSQ
jgi:TonB family protein